MPRLPSRRRVGQCPGDESQARRRGFCQSETLGSTVDEQSSEDFVGHGREEGVFVVGCGLLRTFTGVAWAGGGAEEMASVERNPANSCAAAARNEFDDEMQP